MVDGAVLERQCRGNSTVGSNPTVSAITREDRCTKIDMGSLRLKKNVMT